MIYRRQLHCVLAGASLAWTAEPLKLGIIGLDTSHVLRFTELLNDVSRPDHVAGAMVVAAFQGGSPDVGESVTRIDRFTQEVTSKWRVRLVDSISDLCRQVDAVLLMSVDGRQHLAQVRPVFAAKKRVFIDKPFAGSFADAREIVRLSKEAGVPFFSSSPRRFAADVQELKADTAVGNILGAYAYGPAPVEPHVPDLFWYGIHSVETIYTLMGPGCERVVRMPSRDTDVVVGHWKDGRIGEVRGLRAGPRAYGSVVFGSKQVKASAALRRGENESGGSGTTSGYRGIVSAVVQFLTTGVPPVSPEETLEILAFMQAADLSKARQGAPVALAEVN